MVIIATAAAAELKAHYNTPEPAEVPCLMCEMGARHTTTAQMA